MRTRGEVRREGAPAAAVTPAGRHAALLALLGGPAHVLAAALAAIGPPGSAALLAALSHGDDALLREACQRRRLDAVVSLLRAYGESPDACAGAAAQALAASVMDEDVGWKSVLQQACSAGHAAATVALLTVFRRAGRSHEALAANSHWALRCSIRHPDILSLVLAEYGEPGSDAVLDVLAAGDHAAMRWACHDNSAPAAALLAAAYGPPGCAALRAALAGEDAYTSVLYYAFNAMVGLHPYRAADRTGCDALLAALLAALAEPDNASAVRALNGWLTEPKDVFFSFGAAERLARIPPDSLLARLAVAAPAAWALAPVAARALLSAPVRASLVLPLMLALRRLPAGAAAPVAAFLRAQPWCAFSAACVPPPEMLP